MNGFSIAAAALAITFAANAFPVEAPDSRGRLSSTGTPSVGQEAPDFRLLDQNDQVVRLSSARGHKAVVVFYRGYW
jgi:AhpC/TSA family protein